MPKCLFWEPNISRMSATALIIDDEAQARDNLKALLTERHPALDVIGYNRRVDWDELVGRIQRVIDENVTPELH